MARINGNEHPPSGPVEASQGWGGALFTKLSNSLAQHGFWDQLTGVHPLPGVYSRLPEFVEQPEVKMAASANKSSPIPIIFLMAKALNQIYVAGKQGI